MYVELLVANYIIAVTLSETQAAMQSVVALVVVVVIHTCRNAWFHD